MILGGYHKHALDNIKGKKKTYLCLWSACLNRTENKKCFVSHRVLSGKGICPTGAKGEQGRC